MKLKYNIMFFLGYSTGKAADQQPLIADIDDGK